MKSGGFLGKKQARSEPAKTHPPTGSDLTNLLASAQKSPDKTFNLVWQSPSGDNSQYILSVLIGGGVQRGDRRGWSQSAMDNSGVGEAEWKLHREVETKRTEIFSMRSSDAFLIQTFVEDSMALGTGAPSAANDWTPEAEIVKATPPRPEPQSNAPQNAPLSALLDSLEPPHGGQAQASRPAQSPAQAPAPTATGVAPYHEGNLRRTNIRTIMEAFNSHRTTGRLICDIGTVTAEVFFTDGEPVHAKSCHSIYGNRDTIGDVSVVDLLTWKEGDFKFQDGWPAASRTVTMPLSKFLSGEAATALADAAATAAAATASAAAQASAPPAQAPGTAPAAAASQGAFPATSGASPAPSNNAAAGQDDFSKVDALIGETYSSLTEKSGLLKYGMFLMLVRCEFVRFEGGQNPFCVASIGLELPNHQPLTDPVLGKLGECFDSVCEPLDILAYAGNGRLYAMFPQSTHVAASGSLTNFLRKLAATQLDNTLNGSQVKVSIGLAQVPNDGFDFLPIFEHAGKLRRAATPERSLMMSPS